MSLPPLIWDEFQAEHVPPEGMDDLWAQGWRHFGTHFFRYSLMAPQGSLQTVVPLRVELSRFAHSKSQRRVLRRNKDVSVQMGPAELTDEVHEMFQRHKMRFSDNVPEDLRSFLSDQPSHLPCHCSQVRCLIEGTCVAVSFFDVGAQSVSSVYAVFEPAFSSRSLGIFTILQEMEWARAQGMKYAYPGYASLGPSHYDYKKQFAGLEGYDWSMECWMPWEAFGSAENSPVLAP
jgi:arginyl-tRNA--protein-N-Asp/Glu arginylyltransferase